MKFFTAYGKTYRKTDRLTVEKRLEKGETVRGFTVGNKVRQNHWFSGWCLAHSFDLSSKDKFVKEWDSALFYLEPELGSGLAIWVEVEA